MEGIGDVTASGRVLTPDVSYIPPLGKIFNTTERRYTNTSPAKKFGMAAPIKENAEEM